MAPIYEIEFTVPRRKEPKIVTWGRRLLGDKEEPARGTLTTTDLGRNWRGDIESADGQFRQREISEDGTAVGETFQTEEVLLDWLKRKYAISELVRIDEEAQGGDSEILDVIVQGFY